MSEYDHREIEQKWQKEWTKQGLYTASDTGKDNFFLLVEFPYPSGNLHIGHWYAFALPDIYARFKRMKGSNVLFPLGFDSFGLPAENAAIKRGLDPEKWTNQNIEYMRGQLASMGASFDWSREVQTSSPDFYKWTQYIFTQLFEKNLAYEKLAHVNWCPSCQTVLANEQVISGLCERCDSEVEQKEMKQWFLRITEYADRLLDDLENLDWPEEIKQAQRNWIGKKEGTRFSFNLSTGANIDVFTTRPDTLFGVTYVVLAPEHTHMNEILESVSNRDEVEAYIAQTQKKSDLERQENKDKTGVELKGVTAQHPATGDEVPVWVADYVLASYGTGAVMAVPAHDERDFAFANRFDLLIKPVVVGSGSVQENWSIENWGDEWNVWYMKSGKLINSGEFDGMESSEAKEKITEKYGTPETTYRLRDWSIGRQRYWGTPIPIVYNPEGLPHAVPQEHLPWELPKDVDHTPRGEAPLATSKELKERTEKIFGEGWTPVVDTMDTFVDSSWYFVRYTDPHNEKAIASKENMQNWLPVDLYSGGAEHTTMHLLYSRFFFKAMADCGLVFGDEEPYTRRLNRGLIMGPDGHKMSKSRGNVIDPDEQVERLGADSVRLYLAFIGPYNETGSYPWDVGGIVGVRRFIEKVWNTQSLISEDQNEEVENRLHKLIHKVEEDILRLKFNTAISACMEFMNFVSSEKQINQSQFSRFLQILAPFAPHITEELWSLQENTSSIHLTEWPSYDESRIQNEQITIVVQVDGKVRASFSVTPGESKEVLEERALALPEVGKWIKDVEIQRVIVVPDKLVSIVTK